LRLCADRPGRRSAAALAAEFIIPLPGRSRGVRLLDLSCSDGNQTRAFTFFAVHAPAMPCTQNDFLSLESSRAALVTAPVTVWYDGGCPLCVREIALMNQLDRHDRIEFVNVDREDASCPVDRQLLLRRMHAQEGDGPLVDGAAAFAAMWRAIPLFRPLGLLAKNRVVLWAFERLYRGFLVVRPGLQRVFLAVFGTRARKRRSAG